MKTLWMMLISFSVAVAACGTNPGGQVPDATLANPPVLDTPTSVPTHIPVDQTPAQRAAIAQLAKGLGIPESQISVVSSEAVVWPNGCMGVQRLGVMCTMNQVPGFRITLEANHVAYEVHTNRDGSIVAPEQPAPAPTAAEKVAVHQLASNLGIADSAVKVVSTAMVEWPDSCLGVAQQGVMCAQMVTPGYLVTLEADGRQYDYHTNGDASEVMPGSLAMDWAQNGGIAGLCQNVTVYLSGEIYGQDCHPGGDSRMGVLTAAQRTQLYAWYDKLANTTIDLSDPKGAADAMTRTADLFSSGPQPATDADKKAIFDFGQSLYHSLYR
jgi:hypothetical protein